MDEWELEAGQNDDYEYGYDYLYEEIRPIDAPKDADEPEEDSWWEEDEEALFAEAQSTYRELGQEDEAVPTRSYAEILAEIRAEEKEQRETGAQRAKKRLVRDMKAEALLRMESAARSEAEFRAVQEVWDDNDKSCERYLRLHEVLQGNTEVEAITDTLNAAAVPLWLNDPTVRQLQRGNFLDYLADCPYEMHNLTAKEYIRRSVYGMKGDHKELFFLLYLRLYSPQHVAALRGQTDRNIRKVRDVMLRKLREKVYQSMKAHRGYPHFTRQEQEFLDVFEAKGADLK